MDVCLSILYAIYICTSNFLSLFLRSNMQLIVCRMTFNLENARLSRLQLWRLTSQPTRIKYKAIEKCEGVSCLLASSSPYTSGIIIRQHGSVFKEMLMLSSAALCSFAMFFLILSQHYVGGKKK